MVAPFGDTSLICLADSDADSGAKSIKYFLDDLDRTIITTALEIFSEVPPLFNNRLDVKHVENREKLLAIWEELPHRKKEEQSQQPQNPSPPFPQSAK